MVVEIPKWTNAKMEVMEVYFKIFVCSLSGLSLLFSETIALRCIPNQFYTQWKKKKDESLFDKVKLFCYLFQDMIMFQNNNDKLICIMACSLFYNMVNANDNANAVLAKGNLYGPCFCGLNTPGSRLLATVRM